jgi:hypothetical protein
MVNNPDQPESLGKFEKRTWNFNNGNVEFTVYQGADSQDLALNNTSISALGTGVKVER